jgi:hypothetical protein
MKGEDGEARRRRREFVDEALQKWIFNFAGARESSFVSKRMYRGHRYIEQC